MSGNVQPTGTVTFLFTDLVGSTALWVADHDGTAASVAHHDRILRDIFHRRNGYVFTTAGDSFAVAFADANTAIGVAIETQRELASTTWPGPALAVRIGLHTGVSDERDGDYFGPEVTLAARIMAISSGGQILASAATVELAVDHASVDLGEHRLKGFDRVHRIHQIRGEGLEQDFPDLPTSSNSNLPELRTDVVGREDDIAAVAGHIDDHRLVTIHGPGGVGKTTVAVAASYQVHDRADVHFVDLTTTNDEAGIWRTMATAVGLADSSDRPMRDQVAAWMRDRPIILVMDNCEHVMDESASVIDDLLAATGVRIVATSREVLDLPDEVVLVLSPLDLPGPGASFDTAVASPSVELFRRRAVAVDPEFDLRDCLDSVLRICRLVDGLPLAIELAAARLRSLSATDLAEHLATPTVAWRGRRGGPARQRTLHSVIAWSHDLLDEDEQRAFAHLSVFAGGWTLRSAEAVLPDRLGSTEMLSRLVDKSLVVLDRHPAGGRYRMLETIRSFATDRLVERGEREHAAHAHLAWARALVDDLERDMHTPAQTATMQSAEPDFENLRVARDWADGAGNDLETSLRITTWAPIDNHVDRIRRLVHHFDSAEPFPDRLLAHARYTAVAAGFESGRYAETIEHADIALELFARLGDQERVAATCLMKSYLVWGSTPGPAIPELLHRAREIASEVGDVEAVAFALWGLALWDLRERHDLDAASERAQLAVEMFTDAQDEYGLAHALECRARVRMARGDSKHALADMGAAFDRLADMGILGCAAHALDGVALAAIDEGDLRSGAELLGAADRLRSDTNAARRPWDVEATDELLALLKEGLAHSDLDRAQTRGGSWTNDELRRRIDELTEADAHPGTNDGK